METRRIKSILDDLPGPQPKFKETQEDNGDTSLFQLLDEVANGRKLMNFLFSTETINAERDLNKNGGMRRHERTIAGDWYDEEKRGSTQVTSATLQLDTPVIFSWSDNGRSTMRTPTQSPTVDPKNRKQVTTNQRLLKDVSTGLKQLGLDDIRIGINEEEAYATNEYSGENGTLSQDSLKKEWKKSNFKVDPLQTFVVKELPKEKKVAERETPKSKSKHRGVLWFWGKGKSKKSKHKKTTSKPSESGGGSPKKPTSKTHREEEDGVWDLASSEEERVIGIGLQRVSLDADTQEEVVHDFQPSMFKPGLQQKETVQSDEDGDDDDDGDDDFGEFQQVRVPQSQSQPQQQKPQPADLLDLDTAPVKEDLNPQVTTFIPLQPKKR